MIWFEIFSLLLLAIIIKSTIRLLGNLSHTIRNFDLQINKLASPLHEAAHIIMAWLLFVPVKKISINQYGGKTFIQKPIPFIKALLIAFAPSIFISIIIIEISKFLNNFNSLLGVLIKILFLLIMFSVILPSRRDLSAIIISFSLKKIQSIRQILFLLIGLILKYSFEIVYSPKYLLKYLNIIYDHPFIFEFLTELIFPLLYFLLLELVWQLCLVIFNQFKKLEQSNIQWHQKHAYLPSQRNSISRFSKTKYSIIKLKKNILTLFNFLKNKIEFSKKVEKNNKNNNYYSVNDRKLKKTISNGMLGKNSREDVSNNLIIFNHNSNIMVELKDYQLAEQELSSQWFQL